MRKVCIVIPDGTGIRNYLFSNLIKELFQLNAEVSILHSISEKAIQEINTVHGTDFKTYKLPIYKEGFYQKYLRETICFARLLSNNKEVNNETILTNWKPNKGNLKTRFFYYMVELLGNFVSKKYNRILSLKKWYENSLKKEKKWKYKFLLEDINPDILFSTHQRAMNAIPLMYQAKQLGIKTVGAIFSWDNLPKARLSVSTDNYIVWSEYMRKELNLYYPEIKNEKIRVTGTPQFEFYNNQEYIIEKETFFKRFNLDLTKKTFCFSGDDEKTSPFDPNYLEDIASVIDKKNLNIQIVLRRAPVDVSGRFENVISKYSSIIKEIRPLWNYDKNDKKNWQIIYPTYNDVKLLINTVKYCDAVINVGSTMAHDFAMFGKPAIYINYNAVKPSFWDIGTIYKYQHFRSMVDLKPVFWLNSKREISKLLKTIFDIEMVDNKKWLDIIAEHKKEASFNIAKMLVECI